MTEQDTAPIAVRQRSARSRSVRWRAGRAGRNSLRLVLRVIHPKTVGRLTIAEGRGLGRAVHLLSLYLRAADLSDLRAKDPRRHHEIRQTRAYTAGGVAAVVLIAAVIVILKWQFTQWAFVLTVLVVLGILGRKGRILADAPDLPILAPADLIVRQAFVDARLAKTIDDVRVTQPVARDRGAWHTVVRLPAGIPARAAVAKRPALASALGIGTIQLDLIPMRGNERDVEVWGADRDPYDRKPVVSPLVKHPRQCDIWKPVTVGLDAREHEVLISLMFSGVLIGGLPRMGKTVSANNLLAPILLDPHVRLIMADGKGMDSEPYRHLAEEVGTRDPDSLLDILDRLEQDMDQRIHLLTSLGLDKLTREAALSEPRLAPTVVWIDELRHYTDCPGRETRKQINSKLIELASVGPATGILPVFATQRPSGEVVPTDLRDLIPVRWALACSTSAASDMVLGQGAASQGSNAAELDRERKGVGILVGTGARSITLRSMLIEVDGMRRVAEEATKLRRAAGMLPTGRPGRPEAPAILGSILSALEAGEGVEAMRTAELIDVLRQANPAQWGDLDAVSLATKVRPWGLGPRQLGQFGGENNPRGYRLTDVQQAIAVATGKAG